MKSRKNPLFTNTEPSPADQTFSTTIHLTTRQLVTLDAALLNLLDKHGARLNRSELIRALVDGLADMTVNWNGSQIELKKRA